MKIQSSKIVLIGAGNVATQLGIALQDAGHTILQVYSRKNTTAKILAKSLKARPITDLKKINTEADFYFISVTDDAIKDVVKKIKFKNKIVIHTSGSTAINVLKNTSKNYGVFYPLQTISKNKKINFKVTPICLEANNIATLKVLQQLSRSISNTIQKINSDQRKALHIAAIFACNFSNHLYTIAEQIISKNKLSFELLKPLILETADKIKNNSPVKMQTGPAIRGDKKIMDVHIKMLSGNKEYKQLYKLLSKSIIKSKSGF